MKTREEIIKIIKKKINTSKSRIESFKKEENFLWSIEWRLNEAIEAGIKVEFLTEVLKTLESNDDTIEVISHFRDKYLLDFLTSGKFNKLSTSKETNMVALIKGETYGKLLKQFDVYIDCLKEPV